MKFASVALIVSTAAATDLKLTWSDCGAGATHAKIASFTPDSITLGTKTTLTGIGALDESVTGATFDLKMTGAIGTLVQCSGDASASKTCSLPLGTGSLTFDAMTFPLAAGKVPVKVDLSLSSTVPASLQTTTTTCSATATGGDALFCIAIKSAPGAQAIASDPVVV